MKKYIVLLVTILSISSCLNKKYDYPVAKLPQTPENLELFNTEYNDYNSTCPTISSLFPLCFSSDRNSEGEDFDIIYHPMNITWNKESGRLTVIPDYAGWSQYYELYEVLNEGMDVINSSANEFGPYFIADLVTYDSEYDFLLIFSNDVTGKQQIKYSLITICRSSVHLKL